MFFLIDASANTSAAFGPGTGTVYGRSVTCSGNEDSLINCGFNTDVTSCTHLNDAGVTCTIGGKVLLRI